MKRCFPIILPVLICLILTGGCGQESNNHSGLSYKETKAMVIDILKSEDAKKVIEEVNFEQQKAQAKMQDELFQLLSSPQGQQIQIAVKDILTDPSYPNHLRQLMTDPKFAGEFAKAVQKENKEIHKQLMKDPEYQTLLIEVMKDKEFQEIVFEVLKGKDYRKQTMMVMQEAMESPIFRMELMELMKKVIDEESRPVELGKQEEDKKEKEKDEGGDKKKDESS